MVHSVHTTNLIFPHFLRSKWIDRMEVNNECFGISQVLKEFDLPQIHPPDYYQHEKSKHKRRRRAIYPNFMPELRVMRSDIRRKFGVMYTNMINSHDSSLLTRFFEDFTTPDCQIIRVNPPSSEVGKNSNSIIFNENYRAISGLKEAANELNLTLKLMPDHSTSLQECQVRIRQGSQGSMVVFKMLSRGVRAFTAYRKQEVSIRDKCKSSDTPDRDRMCDSTDNESSSGDEITSPLSTCSSFSELHHHLAAPNVDNLVKIEDSGYYLELAPVPVETIAAVMYVLILDENHYIRQLHIEYNCISEKPIF